MNWLRKILTVVGYVGVGGAPILASTGVGAPAAAALGAVGILAGAVLHFLDSPTKSTQELLALGKQTKDTIDAVKAAKST